MAHTLVLGYGNPLRGDDGVGWRVAEAIAARCATQDVLVRTGQQPVPEWAADLSRAAVAYFVDASPGAEAARLEHIGEASVAAPVNGHAVTPADLLQLTRAVYGHTPRAYLVHVPAAQFAFGEVLSPVATRGVRAAIRLVAASIQQCTS